MNFAILKVVVVKSGKIFTTSKITFQRSLDLEQSTKLGFFALTFEAWIGNFTMSNLLEGSFEIINEANFILAIGLFIHIIKL